MVTKIADVPHLVPKGRADPTAAFPEIRALAASDDWRAREVAATALVEISKKQPDAVVAEVLLWARDADANVRRAASEGLRGLARTSPDAVRPVIELLRGDPALYVRKSVANILRDASKRHPEFVLDLCCRWATAADTHTGWVIRHGLEKLKETAPEQVELIIRRLGGRTPS